VGKNGEYRRDLNDIYADSGLPDAVISADISPVDGSIERMSLSGLRKLYRTSQCALIIGHKFLDTSICEFVCDVKGLPEKA
jgi:hypothetical protein